MSLYVCFKGSHMKPTCFHMLFKGSFKGQWISAFHLRSLRTHLIAAALPVAPYWFFIPLTETSAVVDSKLYQALPRPEEEEEEGEDEEDHTGPHTGSHMLLAAHTGPHTGSHMLLAAHPHWATHWITYAFGFWQPTLDHTLDHICFWQPPWKSKNTILHCKIYVFASFCYVLKVQNAKKHTFYNVKCVFFQFCAFLDKTCIKIFSSDRPSKKTYILQCKKYVFDSGAPKFKFQSKIGKTYILQCKMYVFGNFGCSEHSKNRNFIPKLERHTFYSVKCMFFGILDLQNIAKICKNWQKHTFYSVKLRFLIFKGAAKSICDPVCRPVWAAKSICDPVCGPVWSSSSSSSSSGRGSAW